MRRLLAGLTPVVLMTQSLALLTACSGGSSIPTSSSLNSLHSPYSLIARGASSSPIQHIVIIVQENRTTDNLFYGFPGADTTPPIALAEMPLNTPNDLSHIHLAFLNDMKGQWEKGSQSYVRRSDVVPYWTMAQRYVLADRFFQTNEGPSFPAHQYLVSGTSSIAQGSPLFADGNPGNSRYGDYHQGGCDSSPGTTVSVLDVNNPSAPQAAQYPCYERTALTDLLDAKGLTWRYYQNTGGSGLWNALDAIRHIRASSEYGTNVVSPSKTVLTDIAAGTLANVTWITPSPADSDHPHSAGDNGPSWVASIVNTVGHSKYWSSTAIFVTWDDWGGWYDHVVPQQRNAYELGFRVPLLVISPYAKQGYVLHEPSDFGSILKFVEQNWNLGSMHTADATSGSLDDAFDFTASRNVRFQSISAPLGTNSFVHEAADDSAPDSD